MTEDADDTWIIGMLDALVGIRDNNLIMWVLRTLEIEVADIIRVYRHWGPPVLAPQ
jgi:hypothetical protein